MSIRIDWRAFFVAYLRWLVDTFVWPNCRRLFNLELYGQTDER